MSYETERVAFGSLPIKKRTKAGRRNTDETKKKKIKIKQFYRVVVALVSSTRRFFRVRASFYRRETRFGRRGRNIICTLRTDGGGLFENERKTHTFIVYYTHAHAHIYVIHAHGSSTYPRGTIVRPSRTRREGRSTPPRGKRRREDVRSAGEKRYRTGHKRKPENFAFSPKVRVRKRLQKRLFTIIIIIINM